MSAKRIIICGAGRVGFNLARYLSEHSSHVTVIDSSEDLINTINDRLEVKAVHGYASHPEILARAGADDADMLVAVTASDEVNMMACEVAHSLFKVPTKIARIRHQAYLNPQWGELFSSGALSVNFVISPEREVAGALGRSLTVPGIIDLISLSDDRVKIGSVRITESTPIVNTPITHITGLFNDLNMSIIGIARGDEQLIPTEKEVLQVRDKVYFAVSAEQLREAMTAFGYDQAASKRLLILGGGNIGMCLAQMIEKYHPHIRAQIIEKNPQRAEAIVSELSDTIVLCGDALDREMLKEAEVGKADTVIAVTEDDRVNVLASILAKRQGAQRTFALTNSSSYESLVVSLGIDAVINPRIITVSKILQYVKGGSIRAVYSLGDTFGEILEVELGTGSGLAGTTVKSINIPHEVAVAAIVRDSEVIIPKASTTFQFEDRVVLIVAPRASSKVEKLFSNRLDYY